MNRSKAKELNPWRGTTRFASTLRELVHAGIRREAALPEQKPGHRFLFTGSRATRRLERQINVKPPRPKGLQDFVAENRVVIS